jgi:HlyD family secretion protein
LEVDNPELLLRPGMTATAEIVTTNIQNALLIPNAALRFTPPSAEGANGSGGASARPGGPLSAIMPMPRFRMGGNRNGQQQGAGRRMGKAYVLEGGQPALVMFRAGATDGRMTEVLPFDRPPNANGNRPGAAAGGGNGTRMGPPGISPEELQKAFERKLEEGTKVVVDIGAPAP